MGIDLLNSDTAKIGKLLPARTNIESHKLKRQMENGDKTKQQVPRYNFINKMSVRQLTTLKVHIENTVHLNNVGTAQKTSLQQNAHALCSK